MQKYLADCGICSRRRAEVLITEGKVTVNGQIAEIGTKITPGADEVTCNGAAVMPIGQHVYILLNKPVGVITSASDQFGRKTVLDLVGDVGVRLFPVGRLDYSTSGLILLTNNGQLANKLMHPKGGMEKTYMATVHKPLAHLDIKAFADGVDIDGYVTRPAVLEITSVDKKSAKIILREGRNRQIHRMFEALGNDVLSLERVALGTIYLEGLLPGQYRHLTVDEIAGLR